MGLIDNLAINNNGALIMHANTTITNTIFTRACSDSVYIDIPVGATKTYKVAVLVDTYSISKIVTTNVDTDTIELVGVVENNTLKQNFVIRSNFDGLYIHKVYKIVYNFGGGNYLYETQEFSVVDQDSYIVISHNNLSKAGYTFDGIYRYKNNKYIDINGPEVKNYKNSIKTVISIQFCY